jgi:hypothetical protein
MDTEEAILGCYWFLFCFCFFLMNTCRKFPITLNFLKSGHKYIPLLGNHDTIPQTWSLKHKKSIVSQFWNQEFWDKDVELVTCKAYREASVLCPSLSFWRFNGELWHSVTLPHYLGFCLHGLRSSPSVHLCLCSPFL